ncbi:MAG: hypothetical protein KKF89_02220, partial [Nanoarchaeota archaeon]|nr:hypothetical protein [Nanoarchaeota archaeon]
LIKKSYPEERKSKLSNAYNKLTFPPVLSYINRMLLDKLKLIIEVKKHGKEKCEKKIDKFINDYYWINFKWGESEEYTKEQFLEEAKKIRNTKENYNNETKRFKEEIKAKKSYLKEIEGKFPIIKNYIKIFDEYTVLHDLRKEGQVKVVYCIREIYKIIAKRNNVDCNKLYFLWPAELVESIKKKKFDKTLMTKRSKEWYCVHYKNGDSEEYFGEEALKKRDEAIKINKEDYNKELLGMSASQGRIIGTARVCFSADEAMKKVKKGDILVTGMTMPEFVPVMKKAAAIVTDEGGLTCHAAIISRELGKPCVVGTKMATRIIKDGDLIEVNANHGIIKIIK